MTSQKIENEKSSVCTTKLNGSASIDAVTVIPIEAPNGCGPFRIDLFIGSAVIGFNELQSAQSFVDSLPES